MASISQTIKNGNSVNATKAELIERRREAERSLGTAKRAYALATRHGNGSAEACLRDLVRVRAVALADADMALIRHAHTAPSVDIADAMMANLLKQAREEYTRTDSAANGSVCHVAVNGNHWPGEWKTRGTEAQQ